MKTNRSAQGSGWNVSFWFALSSPLLGVLVGILAAAIFCRWFKRPWAQRQSSSSWSSYCSVSIRPDQVRTQLALKDRARNLKFS